MRAFSFYLQLERLQISLGNWFTMLEQCNPFFFKALFESLGKKGRDGFEKKERRNGRNREFWEKRVLMSLFLFIIQISLILGEFKNCIGGLKQILHIIFKLLLLDNIIIY